MHATPPTTAPRSERTLPTGDLLERFRATRALTHMLAAPLSAEDAMVQSMAEASPAKWHLAHTSWFFERFILANQRGYRAFDPSWDYLFNSYYNSVGPMHERARRGVLSRPTLEQVRAYRDHVEAHLETLLRAGALDRPALDVLELGIQHEQQHQELLLTDIKHAFWSNPLQPGYRQDLPSARAGAAPLRWIARDEQMIEIGAPAWPAALEFAYDNESPRHRILVPAHALANRPVSNAEYQAFIDDGGYRNPALWLSDGWSVVQARQWMRPLYWRAEDTREFTLAGWRERDPDAPVCALSLFEADAFARWAGARLPTEAEWEQAAAGAKLQGNFVERGVLHPQSSPACETGFAQLFGDVWEWTASAYLAYPGFIPWPGSLGEYNGKFMNAQWVLRGGSCASPRRHIRASYRNFFPSDTRWQFAGVRLAKDSL